jgi:hypothetical protein
MTAATRYTRLRAQRAEQRRLKRITELTARVGRIAQQIHELDEAAGRPVDSEVSAVVREAFRILKQSKSEEKPTDE